jgi:hypothetical protein
MESISTLLTQLQAEGDEILLQLDANTAPTDQEWVTFLSTHNLVDLHGIISSNPFPNSYASGTEKIDYMLGTNPLCAAAVRRGGIRNFTKGPHSDHRGMYLDLDSATLFSEKCVDPTRPAARQLRLGNKRTINTYLQILQAQLQHHNVFDRIDKLSEQAVTLPENTITRKYNAIDDDITAACKFAEKLCSRTNYGFPFSAKLVKCGSNIVQLKKQIRFIHRGQKTLFHIIPSQIRRNNLDKSATLKYCYSQLRILQLELKDIQEDSIRHREEFLTQLARDSHENSDTIETTQEREKIKQSYRTLKRFVKQKPTGLNKLEVYDYDTTGNIIGTKILTCPASISTALIEQQYKQFGQAQFEEPFFRLSTSPRPLHSLFLMVASTSRPRSMNPCRLFTTSSHTYNDRTHRTGQKSTQRSRWTTSPRASKKSMNAYPPQHRDGTWATTKLPSTTNNSHRCTPQ